MVVKLFNVKVRTVLRVNGGRHSAELCIRSSAGMLPYKNLFTDFCRSGGILFAELYTFYRKTMYTVWAVDSVWLIVCYDPIFIDGTAVILLHNLQSEQHLQTPLVFQSLEFHLL